MKTDNNAPTYQRRKHVKTYKNKLSPKWTVAAKKFVRRSTPEKEKDKR